MTYLDFETSIKELNEELIKLKDSVTKSDVCILQPVNDLKKKIEDEKKKVYSKLTNWQRVQLSRHPNRPYSLEYIEKMSNNTFVEMHGDRCYGDDKSIVGGFGFIEKQSVMFIGQQKGVNTKMKIYRNFGMPNPEGYRKAIRLMKLAEKFEKPVVCLIDTPGAFPGIEAETRGQAEAIAKNLFEMSKLQVPIICIIIGEGASGGALGIGVGDKTFMMENSWFSVISPESCSSILWGNWEQKEKSAEILRLSSQQMFKMKLIDQVIKEPLGGAHYDRNEAIKIVRKKIKSEISKLKKIDKNQLVNARLDKYFKMGSYKEEIVE